MLHRTPKAIQNNPQVSWFLADAVVLPMTSILSWSGYFNSPLFQIQIIFPWIVFLGYFYCISLFQALGLWEQWNKVSMRIKGSFFQLLFTECLEQATMSCLKLLPHCTTCMFFLSIGISRRGFKCKKKWLSPKPNNEDQTGSTTIITLQRIHISLPISSTRSACKGGFFFPSFFFKFCFKFWLYFNAICFVWFEDLGETTSDQ